jgi:hypothetical protein
LLSVTFEDTKYEVSEFVGNDILSPQGSISKARSN